MQHNSVLYLLQSPCLQSASCSNSPPPLSHRYHLGQTVWCQLPISLVLWPMRASSSGSGPSHLGSPSHRCGSLMGQGPALYRYPRSLLPMQGTTHAKPASMGSLPRALLSFNLMVAKWCVIIQWKPLSLWSFQLYRKTRNTISNCDSDQRQFFSHAELWAVWLPHRNFSRHFMELWWWWTQKWLCLHHHNRGWQQLDSEWRWLPSPQCEKHLDHRFP